MPDSDEKVIGTLLLCTTPQGAMWTNYNITFTSNKIILYPTENVNMKAAGIGLNAAATRGGGTRIMLERAAKAWLEIKEQNKGKSIVSYDSNIVPEAILKEGKLGAFTHNTVLIPYEKLKKIEVKQNNQKGIFQDAYSVIPENESDYRIVIHAGLMDSGTLLIPDYGLEEFKDLISKTPAENKLQIDT